MSLRRQGFWYARRSWPKRSWLMRIALDTARCWPRTQKVNTFDALPQVCVASDQHAWFTCGHNALSSKGRTPLHCPPGDNNTRPARVCFFHNKRLDYPEWHFDAHSRVACLLTIEMDMDGQAKTQMSIRSVYEPNTEWKTEKACSRPPAGSSNVVAGTSSDVHSCCPLGLP